MQAVPRSGPHAGHAAGQTKPGAAQVAPAAFTAVMAIATKIAAPPAKTRHASAPATATAAGTRHADAQIPAFALFHLAQPADQQPAVRATRSDLPPAVTDAPASTSNPPETASTASRLATHALAADQTIAKAKPEPAETAAAAAIPPAPVKTQDSPQIGAARVNADKVPPSASAPAAAALPDISATPVPAVKPIATKSVASDKPAVAMAAAASGPAISPTAAATGVIAPAAPPPPSAPATPPPAAASMPQAAGIAATPAALAASITAMHRNGQTSATLRLDPPGLGTLSIHLALGHADTGSAGQVNLLMVPAVTQTAQLLNSGIDSLRQALAAAGLTLGQAQIGHGGQGGQNAAPDPQQSSSRPASTTSTPVTDVATNSPGVRAYA